MDYQPGETLSAMLHEGKLRNAQAVEETLALARQAFKQHAWDDEPHVTRQYEADISLLLDMLRYERELATLPQMLHAAIELSIETRRQGGNYGDSD